MNVINLRYNLYLPCEWSKPKRFAKIRLTIQQFEFLKKIFHGSHRQQITQRWVFRKRFATATAFSISHLNIRFSKEKSRYAEHKVVKIFRKQQTFKNFKLPCFFEKHPPRSLPFSISRRRSQDQAGTRHSQQNQNGGLRCKIRQRLDGKKRSHRKRNKRAWRSFRVSKLKSLLINYRHVLLLIISF